MNRLSLSEFEAGTGLRLELVARVTPGAELGGAAQ